MYRNKEVVISQLPERRPLLNAQTSFENNRRWWEKRREKYLAGKMPPVELFPYREITIGWDRLMRELWRREVLETLKIDESSLRAEVPQFYFRFWGPRKDNGRIGWLTESDFLEDTDLPYDVMYGMPQADYQHGWCPGITRWVEEITGGREFLMIINLGEN